MNASLSDLKEWKLKALTDIWTGDAERRGDRLIPTGLLGSIRWWFEVLVRGLGGKACDPSDSHNRCPQDSRKKPTDPGHHCVVCELFGCTGWARKFRLMVLDSQGQVIQGQIKANTEFTLRFVALRTIREEEWCLLDLTMRLLADYGAIGGKTVLKPSNEQGRQNAFHHRDFGLIQYLSAPDGWSCARSQSELTAYVCDTQWRKPPDTSGPQGQTHDFSWASLQNFWCVKGRYLARQYAVESTFNQVIGRKERKKQAQQLESDTPVNRWLAGRQQESKKVFSFKAGGRRTFGFVKPGTVEFDEIKQRLRNVWSGFNPDSEFKEGDNILSELFRLRQSSEGGAP
ncbi:MAG TPA: type III-B CRISPR module RAMP protein Cmr1 [Blastocatellia bacterium]|nr:type III-B CRISPR module RAMP protein Cmr1 [Blastocatellia bacterium]